jgi:glucose/arabinose dehydrogenase
MTFRTKFFSSTFVLVACLAAPEGVALADDLASGAPADTFDVEDAYVEGLTNVTGIRFLPDGRLLITEQGGALKVRAADGAIKTAYTFSVVPTGANEERGLLGVVAHPDFATNKRIIAYWSRSDEAGGTNVDRHRVASYVLNDDNTLDFDSENILVEGLEGPDNHDGGALDIGPDRMLYVGTGDTGCNGLRATELNEYHGNLLGTAMNSANGKILRVDPNKTYPNSAPADNPFVGRTNVSGVPIDAPTCDDQDGWQNTYKVRDEIFAAGFRNAFRLWVDPATNLVWVGDVGDETFEEVDIVEKGQHHGWPLIEGPGRSVDWPVTKCSEVVPVGQNCTPPAYACRHGETDQGGVQAGCKSITGGLIVDSCKFPTAFRGTKYFFADNAVGNIWTLDITPGRRGVVPTSRQDFIQVNGGPVELTEGPDGALYYAVRTSGPSRIARVFPKTPANDPNCVRPGPGTGGGAGAGGTSGAGQGGGPTAGRAGSPAGGAAGSAGAPNAGQGGASGTGNGADGDDDDGCGCRVVGPAGSATPWLVALAASVAGLLRRGRRRE